MARVRDLMLTRSATVRMTYDSTRVMIWGKTYPELSSRYVETVCTGGVRMDGRPIRLYPVPLRYLESGHNYSLYDVVDIPTRKSTSDPRPESFKVHGEGCKFVSKVSTENGTWRSRTELIFRDPSWHFDSVGALKLAQRSPMRRSLGLITPGKIEGISLRKRTDKERREYDRKMKEVQRQGDVFRTEYKDLEFLDCDVKLSWRCRGLCAHCKRNPHDMKALDWGLLELGRREGWEKAKQRLMDLANLNTHDFRIFMGSFRLHPTVFGIIGLWYPKLKVQLDLI